MKHFLYFFNFCIFSFISAESTSKCKITKCV